MTMREVTEMKPRKLGLELLIDLLEGEHRKVESELRAVSGMIAARDPGGLGRLLQSLDEELLQHMLDEESGVLRILIKAYGKEGSRDAIEVFQEHVDIMDLLRELDVSITADRQMSAELLKRLDRLMPEHFRKEDITTFPWALKTNYSMRNGSLPEHVVHPPKQ